MSVPANNEAYEVSQFFRIEDDAVDEDEQCFAVVAEIGRDVPESMSCFKMAVGSTRCNGARGATKIRILDNDGMFYLSQDVCYSC